MSLQYKRDRRNEDNQSTVIAGIAGNILEMTKLDRVSSAVVAALLVTSCGGGGSSPTPSPNATATATPTPTPAPASYQTFAQLTGNQAFSAACGGLYDSSQQLDSGGFARYPNPPQALSHDYNAASQTWTLTGMTRDGVEFAQQFGPADIVATAQANTTAYRRVDGNGFPNRFSIGQPVFGGTGAEYLRNTRLFVRPGAGTSDFSCVIGVPTLLTDIPASTIAFTSFSFAGTAFVDNNGVRTQYDISESTATLTANPANGAIRTTITLVGRAFDPITGGLSATRTQFGMFGGDSAIDGTAQSFGAPLNRLPDNSVGGGFNGWFFGPQGREAGIGFTYFGLAQDGTMFSFGGSFAARR